MLQSRAADDLAFLRSLAGPAPAMARMDGTITKWPQNLDAGGPRTREPAADVVVSVRGANAAFETRTDDRGRYLLSVPPGTYEVTAFPSPPLATSRPRKIEIADRRGCATVDFSLPFDGRISGFLRLSSSAPATGVTVQLRSLRSGNVDYPMRAATDNSGHFVFTELRPGDYLVGFALTRQIERTTTFPQTFYPGTPDQESATVIRLEPGQHRDLDTMTLPPARRPIRITGVVLSREGHPVPSAHIALWDPVNRGHQTAMGVTTEADGRFSFEVHEGLGYFARTFTSGPATGKQRNGTSRAFIATPGRSPLKVTLADDR